MIGTIRKHSKWLWWLIAGLTIISFVVFMGSGPSRGRGGGGEMNYGTVYGHPVTEQEYREARSDVDFFCLVNYGSWLDKDRSITPLQIDRQAYVNILVGLKAKSLGIAVPDQAVVTAATEMLGSSTFNRTLRIQSNKPLEMSQFVDKILVPHGLTDLDFEHFIRSQMVMEQMRLAMGLSGALVTPQEAAALYDHDHQEVLTEAAFFSATNYLARVTSTPAMVGQFFTNYMAEYREPDRVQVNYIWLNITNFLPQAKTELGTNLESIVESEYRKVDPSQFGDVKTPEAQKDLVRSSIIRQRAYQDIRQQAGDFVNTLFAMNPVKLENFNVVAKQKGLKARISQPFAQEGVAEEFANAPDVAKTAFALNQDSPFSDALPGSDGVYIVGLAAQLPSSVPSFDQIQARVARDFKMQEAIQMARVAGTNFYVKATLQVATGKSFAQAAVANGVSPMTLEPFSLSSPQISEIGDHAELGPYKQAAFSTPVNGISHFVSTDEGGFVVYVKSLSPADAATRKAELPQYISQVRRGRENEAFNLWLGTEANREFRDIAALQAPESAAK